MVEKWSKLTESALTALFIGVTALSRPAFAQSRPSGSSVELDSTPLVSTVKPAPFSGFGNGTVTVAHGACAGLSGYACWTFTVNSFKGTATGSGTLTGAVNNSVATDLDTGTGGVVVGGGGTATFTDTRGDTITFELEGSLGSKSQTGWILAYSVTGGTGKFEGAAGNGTLAFSTPNAYGTYNEPFSMSGSLSK